jgi:hypothetical protein
MAQEQQTQAQEQQTQAQVRRHHEHFCTSRRARTSSITSLSLSLFQFSIFIALLSLPIVVKAESRGFLNNGRFFTAALAINNSPQPGRCVMFHQEQGTKLTNLICGSPVHAGSHIVISLEVRLNHTSL